MTVLLRTCIMYHLTTHILTRHRPADFNNNLKTFFFSDRHVEKESLAEYIQKKREMFLVQVHVFNGRLLLCKTLCRTKLITETHKF